MYYKIEERRMDINIHAFKFESQKEPNRITCNTINTVQAYKNMICEGQLQERKLGISKMGHQQSKLV